MLRCRLPERYLGRVAPSRSLSALRGARLLSWCRFADRPGRACWVFSCGRSALSGSRSWRTGVVLAAFGEETFLLHPSASFPWSEYEQMCVF